MAENRVQLVDMHVHLQDEVFEGDLGEVLENARAEGVVKYVCNSTGPGDWEKVRQLCERDAAMVGCFGVHPWFVNELEWQWEDELRGYLNCMGSFVGEIGLDGLVKGIDEELQREVFVRQLRMAKELGKGVMIHCVRSWGAMLDILREEGGLGNRGGLFHGYSGSVDIMDELVEMGGYFSFGASAINPKNVRGRKALKAACGERILLETDSPDMIAVEGFRKYCKMRDNGKGRNEPGNLRIILSEAAKIRGVGEVELAEVVWENSKRFLGELF